MPLHEDNIVPLNTVLERAELIPLSHFGEKAAPVARDLVAQAQADNHCVLNPTHVMMRAGKIVGYLSLNGLPIVHCWFDSKAVHVLDSLKMIEHGQTVFREHGVRDYTVACAEHSPFTPHLERMGFTKLGTTVLWRKTL